MSEKVIKKQFNKQDLKECAYKHSHKLKCVEQTIVDTRRWSIDYEMIFQDKETGIYYQTYFSRGATEMQDEKPYQYNEDIIDCIEVELKEILVKKYIAKETTK